MKFTIYCFFVVLGFLLCAPAVYSEPTVKGANVRHSKDNSFLILSSGESLPDKRGIVVSPPIEKGYTVKDYSRVAGRASNEQVFSALLPGSERVRRKTVQTTLGTMKIAWSTGAEKMLGDRADRVVQGYLQVVSGILEDNSFPESLRSAQYNWNVLVLDSLPRSVNSGLLSSSRCHSAWTGPPANIVISLDRLVKGCRGTKFGEARRTPKQAMGEVFIHEAAHVIEFQLLGAGFGRRQRWHSEGFATWFETLGVDIVLGRTGNSTRHKRRQLARKVYDPLWRSYMFSGTAADYLQSYAMIEAIVHYGSLGRLVDVYRRMSQDDIPFSQAVEVEIGWDEQVWSGQTADLLGMEKEGHRINRQLAE